MKKSIIYASLAALFFSATSCNEEFLETQPTETVSTPPSQYKLNGLYLMMINTGTGGTTGHDDFGQKGYDIFTDMLSADMVLAGVTYGWYSGIANLTWTTDFTSTRNYTPWRYYYRLINGANDVIDGLGGNDANPSSAEQRSAMGQAKALRAYAYFYLLQMFAEKYEPGAAALPLYTKSGSPAAPKSTQSEVYGQIVKDLTDAINLLDGFNRANKGMINKYVAEGLLAYTYAAMGDYAKVEQYSKDIITNGGFSVTSKAESTGGFNSISAPSWMWGFDLTNDNDLDLVSWWGQVDVFSYSYAWAGDPKSIDLGLYAQIKDGDVRKNQFTSVGDIRMLDEHGKPLKDDKGKDIVEEVYNIPADAEEGDVIPVEKLFGIDPDKVAYKSIEVLGISYPAVPANKFYDPNREIGGQRTITTDYLFMRVDEFHMLYAEALAKQGKDAEAKTALKNYLANRITNTSYVDALSGTALQNEIYLQTRIEFWGEGKSYLAMKRNKATIKRGSNHLFFEGQSFNYNDSKLTFKIPQDEVNNNPNL